MARTIALSKAQKIWEEVYTLEKMDPGEFAKRREFYEATAVELAEMLMTGENVICTLGTGGGKTIIALFLVPLVGMRTLFLAPTRALVHQHLMFYQQEMGGLLPARLITGKTPRKERIWDDPREEIVFTTPGAFLSEYQAGNVHPADFGFLILDEAHNARGEHAYSRIGDIAWEHQKPILGISASIGKNDEKIIALSRRLHIFTVVRKEVRRPFVRTTPIFISMDPRLRELEEREITPLHDALRADLVRKLLAGRITPPRETSGIIRSLELERIKQAIDRLPEDTDEEKRVRGRCRFARARYVMFEHAYRTLMREGYAPFLVYAKSLTASKQSSQVKDAQQMGPSRSALALASDMRFRRMVAFARAHITEHPKLIAFLRFAEAESKAGRRVIAFFSQRVSASFIAQELEKRGVPCGVAFGGKAERGETEQRIQELRDGKFLVLLATSVMQEGISVPEVSAVAHYSLPNEWIERLQRDGRTARSRPGEVVLFILEHFFDTRMFYSVMASIRKHEREERERKRHDGGELPYQQYSLF